MNCKGSAGSYRSFIDEIRATTNSFTVSLFTFVFGNEVILSFRVIMEKVTRLPNGQRLIILTVMVSSSSVVLQYFGVDKRPHFAAVRVRIEPNEWHHLAIQIFNTDLSIFIDGVSEDGTPTAFQRLPAVMSDPQGTPIVLVGMRQRGEYYAIFVYCV